MFNRLCFKIVLIPSTSHISCACKTNYVAREGRFMAKLITGSKKKSKNWYPDVSSSSLKDSIFSKPKNPDKKTSRRAVVLNHVFMTHITELLTTGEYSGEVADKKITVTKVKVHPDYKGVNVHWFKKSGTVDEETEKLIKKLQGYLFHQLTTMRVIGYVPPITFVKDKECFNQSEVDSLLASINLTNFEKVDPIKLDFGYETGIETVHNSTQDANECEDPLPPMRHNLYGLEHSKIMNRLKDIVIRRNLVHSGVLNEDKESLMQTQVLKPKEGNYIEFDKKEYAKYFKKKQEERIALRRKMYTDNDSDDFVTNNDYDYGCDYEDDDCKSELEQYEEDK